MRKKPTRVAVAPNDAEDAADGKPRGGVAALLKEKPWRSPTSLLDLRAFAALGGGGSGGVRALPSSLRRQEDRDDDNDDARSSSGPSGGSSVLRPAPRLR
uniref:Uncharacterized protein n=1 Tax=Oryza meridionalis TaxID=40149 RepID=A0A0E0EWW3_9ORYZ